mgnify:CR=1 FL=1
MVAGRNLPLRCRRFRRLSEFGVPAAESSVEGEGWAGVRLFAPTMSQPPPYEVSSAQAPPDGQDDSKGPAPSPHQPLPYQPQLPNGPPTSGAPFVFHVYKAGGLWSKDDIVTGPDKTTIERVPPHVPPAPRAKLVPAPGSTSNSPRASSA